MNSQLRKGMLMRKSTLVTFTQKDVAFYGTKIKRFSGGANPLLMGAFQRNIDWDRNIILGKM